MRLFLVLSALVLAPFAWVSAPSRADAQAIRVISAELREGESTFGRLGNAAVTLARWESRRRARVRLEDRAIALEASIDLRAEGTRVLAGVGEDVAIVGGPWSITMEAGTWAPLVGRGEGDRARVLLPDGLPMRRGTMGRAVPPPAEPPAIGPFSHAPLDWQRWSPICTGVTIRARAEEGGPRWRLRPGAQVRVAGARAPFAIDVWVDGFVLHGHADARPALCGGGIVAGPPGGRACVRPGGELRVVPAGTVIRAPDATVATFRIDVVGQVWGETIEVMHTERDGASWSIVGTIDAPLASLAIASEAPEDMQVCSYVIGWPDE